MTSNLSFTQELKSLSNHFSPSSEKRPNFPKKLMDIYFHAHLLTGRFIPKKKAHLKVHQQENEMLKIKKYKEKNNSNYKFSDDINENDSKPSIEGLMFSTISRTIQNLSVYHPQNLETFLVLLNQLGLDDFQFDDEKQQHDEKEHLTLLSIVYFLCEIRNKKPNNFNRRHSFISDEFQLESQSIRYDDTLVNETFFSLIDSKEELDTNPAHRNPRFFSNNYLDGNEFSSGLFYVDLTNDEYFVNPSLSFSESSETYIEENRHNLFGALQQHADDEIDYSTIYLELPLAIHNIPFDDNCTVVSENNMERADHRDSSSEANPIEIKELMSDSDSNLLTKPPQIQSWDSKKLNYLAEIKPTQVYNILSHGNALSLNSFSPEEAYQWLCSLVPSLFISSMLNFSNNIPIFSRLPKAHIHDISNVLEMKDRIQTDVSKLKEYLSNSISVSLVQFASEFNNFVETKIIEAPLMLQRPITVSHMLIELRSAVIQIGQFFKSILEMKEQCTYGILLNSLSNICQSLQVSDENLVSTTAFYQLFKTCLGSFLRDLRNWYLGSPIPDSLTCLFSFIETDDSLDFWSSGWMMNNYSGEGPSSIMDRASMWSLVMAKNLLEIPSFLPLSISFSHLFDLEDSIFDEGSLNALIKSMNKRQEMLRNGLQNILKYRKSRMINVHHIKLQKLAETRHRHLTYLEELDQHQKKEIENKKKKKITFHGNAIATLPLEHPKAIDMEKTIQTEQYVSDEIYSIQQEYDRKSKHLDSQEERLLWRQLRLDPRLIKKRLSYLNGVEMNGVLAETLSLLKLKHTEISKSAPLMLETQEISQRNPLAHFENSSVGENIYELNHLSTDLSEDQEANEETISDEPEVKGTSSYLGKQTSIEDMNSNKDYDEHIRVNSEFGTNYIENDEEFCLQANTELHSARKSDILNSTSEVGEVGTVQQAKNQNSPQNFYVPIVFPSSFTSEIDQRKFFSANGKCGSSIDFCSYPLISTASVKQNMNRLIQTYTDMVQKSCYEIFTVDYQVIVHFMFMKDIFLLNNGLLMKNLREQVVLSHFHNRHIFSKSIIELSEVLRDILREPLRLWEDQLKEVSERLVFGYTEVFQQYYQENSIWSLDCIIPLYAPKPPLDIIFTPSALASYQRVFQFLIKLVRCDESLNNLVCSEFWKSQKGRPGSSHLTKIIFFLKAQMHVFVRGLLQYSFDVGIAEVWTEFETFLESNKVDSLSKLQSLHVNVLKRISYRLLLQTKQKPVQDLIIDLLQLVLDFSSLFFKSHENSMNENQMKLILKKWKKTNQLFREVINLKISKEMKIDDPVVHQTNIDIMMDVNDNSSWRKFDIVCFQRLLVMVGGSTI